MCECVRWHKIDESLNDSEIFSPLLRHSHAKAREAKLPFSHRKFPHIFPSLSAKCATAFCSTSKSFFECEWGFFGDWGLSPHHRSDNWKMSGTGICGICSADGEMWDRTEKRLIASAHARADSSQVKTICYPKKELQKGKASPEVELSTNRIENCQRQGIVCELKFTYVVEILNYVRGLKQFDSQMLPRE